VKVVVGGEVSATFPKSGAWTYHEYQAGFDTPVTGEEGYSFSPEWSAVVQAETLDECLLFAEVLADQFAEGRSLSRSDATGYVLEELTFEPEVSGFVCFASRDDEPEYWTDSDGDWLSH
jgi:hypothetical protein